MKRPITAKPAGGIEHTLIFALTALLLLYFTVTVRTLWSISDGPLPLQERVAAATAGGSGGVAAGGPSVKDEQQRNNDGAGPGGLRGADTAAAAGGDGGGSAVAPPQLPPGKAAPGTAASRSWAAPSSPDPFPQSIKHEAYETIIHPASEVMPHTNDERIELDVPKFWDPPRFSAVGGVRQHLGRHGARLMTPEEARSVGSLISPPAGLGGTDGRSFVRRADAKPTDQPLETIYVAIASYRDWQCTSTVENVFYRAAYPERIRVAVIDQVDATDDKCARPRQSCDVKPDQILCRHQDQIDVYEMDASLAVGPVFARHLGHRAYRGEYFAMQADAHVEFTQDWDVDIIGQWKSAHNEMAVLTAYLSDIQGSIDPRTGKSLHSSRPIMCRTDYEGYGDERHLRHGQQPEGEPGIRGTPTLEPYWAAGFSFGRGHFVVQVPYDQHLPWIFQGEEISLGLRGFSYGYDYYTPERSVCFHMYAVGKNKSKRKKVKLFWEHSNLYGGSGKKGMARLLGIIRMSNPGVDPASWIHDEKDKYGIGHVRRLQKFFDLYGIHTESRTVEQHLCRFVGKKMQAEFVPHLRENGMGIDYTGVTFRFKDPAPDEKPPPLNGRRGD